MDIRALSVLSGLVLTLFCCVQNASGYAQLEPEKCVWGFFEDPDKCTREIGSDLRGMHLVNYDLGREVALGVVDGPNLYAYVRQNPWTAVDPDGLLAFIPAIPWAVATIKGALSFKAAAVVVTGAAVAVDVSHENGYLRRGFRGNSASPAGGNSTTAPVAGPRLLRGRESLPEIIEDRPVSDTGTDIGSNEDLEEKEGPTRDVLPPLPIPKPKKQKKNSSITITIRGGHAAISTQVGKNPALATHLTPVSPRQFSDPRELNGDPTEVKTEGANFPGTVYRKRVTAEAAQAAQAIQTEAIARPHKSYEFPATPTDSEFTTCVSHIHEVAGAAGISGLANSFESGFVETVESKFVRQN